MPRYYRYGYQGPNYAYGWKGVAARQSQAASLRSGVGDVTDKSSEFYVPRARSPYYIDKASQQLPYFRVPRSKSPYYTHKYGQPPELSGVGSRWGGPGGGGPSGGLGDILATGLSDKQLLLVAGAGAAAWILWRRPHRMRGTRGPSRRKR